MIENFFPTNRLLPKTAIKRIESINVDSIRDYALPKTGFVTKKSKCCNAPIKYDEGGVLMPYCSNCGKIYHEPVLKNS